MIKKIIRIFFLIWSSLALIFGASSFTLISANPTEFNFNLPKSRFASDLVTLVKKLGGPIYFGLSNHWIANLFTAITWAMLLLSVPLILLQFLYVVTSTKKDEQRKFMEFKKIIASQTGLQYTKQSILGIFMLGCPGFLLARSVNLTGKIPAFSPFEFSFNFIISETSLYIFCLLFGYFFTSLAIRIKHPSRSNID